MKAWLVIPPVVVLFGAACIPGPADSSPPPGALADGVVELARSSEALDGLVLESLQETAGDEILLTLAELDGQAGEVEFFLPAQTMTARLLGLEFLAGPDAWMVAGSMEVAGLDARVGYSLAGGGSGECRLRVNVPLRDIHFQLEASPDKPSLEVGPAEVDGERTGIELEPGCPLADLPVFAEQLTAAVVQAGNLGAQQLAGRVAQALATVLGASDNWNGTVSAAWSASGWDGGLGYSISAGAASLWLGAQAAGTRFTGGFWSQPSACLPAGTIDLPAQPLEPVDLDSLLAGQGQAVAALAVSDGFVAQAVVAAWRAGLFCRAPEAGACPGLQLEEWLPSAVSWAGRETRLLLATEAAPLVELAGSNPQGALPAVEVSWPEVRFDFYLDAAGADLRVLSLRADLEMTVRPWLTTDGAGLTLEKVNLGRLEIEYSEPLLEAGGVLRQAAGQLVLQAVQQLAQQLPPWPVSLPAGSGSLLAVRRQAGRSIIFLGP